MGVLNFAHGAFITVGSYATWWMSENVFDGVHYAWLRFLVSALCGLAAGAVFAALVELILIRPLYQRHIEQVLVTVGLSIAFVALVQGIWGPDVHPYTVPGWMHDTTTVLGAHIPNDRWVEIATAAVVLVAAPALPAPDALRADHPRRRREPRDGDGARHRRAQGVHARVRDRRHRRGARRRAERRLLHDDRPEPGNEPADLRLHRGRDRRARLDRRLGDRRRRRRAAAAVRELLRDQLDRRLGPRRSRRPAAARPSCCSRARAASRERSPREQARRRRLRLAARGLRRACLRAEGRPGHPEALRRRGLEPGDAAVARALPALRRARAHVRPAVRLHRAAVVRARAVRRDRRRT